MQKKFLTCFRSVITVLCFVLLFAPAFADMGKVDDAELARTNASVTGASVQDQIVGVEKGMVNPETLQASENFNKKANSSPLMSNTAAPTSVDMNIGGQTTFTFGFGGATSNVTGGIINSAKMH